MIFLLIVAVIISIIILAFSYMRINARVLSRETFLNAAEKQAKTLKYKDPIITCDYCGSQINTAVDKCCPNCGAEYGHDAEWTERHSVDGKWVSDQAENLANQMLQEAREKSASVLRRLKLAIGILFGGLAALIILAVVIDNIPTPHDYAKNEELNKYAYDHYVLTEYQPTENVIFDKDGITISILGIYQDTDDSFAQYKIGYMVDNYSGKNVSIGFERFGLNGYTGGSHYYTYSWFKKNSSTTLYESIYDINSAEITNLAYSDFSIYDGDSYWTSSDEIVVISTDSQLKTELMVPEGDIIYDNNGIVIYNCGAGDRGYRISILNNSDIDYSVSSSDYRIDNETVTSYSFFQDYLPSGFVSYPQEIYDYDYKLENIDENASVELSLSFIHTKDPSSNFATGYLKLR